MERMFTSPQTIQPKSDQISDTGPKSPVMTVDVGSTHISRHTASSKQQRYRPSGNQTMYFLRHQYTPVRCAGACRLLNVDLRGSPRREYPLSRRNCGSVLVCIRATSAAPRPASPALSRSSELKMDLQRMMNCGQLSDERRSMSTRKEQRNC